MTDTDLAALLHDEMTYRIGIPDPHPDKLAVDEPTCQLLAAHLIAQGVRVGDDAGGLRAAAQALVGRWDEGDPWVLRGDIDALRAALKDDARARVDTQEWALLDACHERDIYAPEDLTAALAAQPAPPALDRERLARALRTEFDIYGWDTDEMAARIADAYEADDA